MKKRKDFTPIGIDSLRFQYVISHGEKLGLVVYDENDRRYEFQDIISLNVPQEEFIGVWKGKYRGKKYGGDGGWGKRPVAWIIRNHILNQ